jgi:hypothetical protein
VSKILDKQFDLLLFCAVYASQFKYLSFISWAQIKTLLFKSPLELGVHLSPHQARVNDEDCFRQSLALEAILY